MTILIAAKMMNNFVVFASRTNDTYVAKIRSSSGVSIGVLRGVPAVTYERNDDEDLIEEALIHALKLLHVKWIESTKVNERLLVKLFIQIWRRTF